MALGALAALGAESEVAIAALVAIGAKLITCARIGSAERLRADTSTRSNQQGIMIRFHSMDIVNRIR